MLKYYHFTSQNIGMINNNINVNTLRYSAQKYLGKGSLVPNKI